MTKHNRPLRILATLSIGALVIGFLTGGACKEKPSQEDVNRIANEEATKRACGSLDINTVTKTLTTEAKAHQCFAGFEINQTAAICNASNPPPSATWLCTKCTAPSCENNPENCSTCAANVSAKITLNISVLIKGVSVTISGEVSYAAKVNFANIIAIVRGDPTAVGDQPGFQYWFATTDAASTREGRISGEVSASGGFVGGISLNAGFECSVGVAFRGGKKATQEAASCKGCKPVPNVPNDPLSPHRQAECEIEDEPVPVPFPIPTTPLPTLAL